MKEPKNRDHKAEVQEVLEEKLVVDKKKIETGKVRLIKKVHEEEVQLDLSKVSEEIEIDVRKIGQVVEKPGKAIRVEGDSTVYSVYREVYVKQTILEEEVWVTKKRTTHPIEQPETLRREEIIIERNPSTKNSNKE